MDRVNCDHRRAWREEYLQVDVNRAVHERFQCILVAAADQQRDNVFASLETNAFDKRTQFIVSENQSFSLPTTRSSIAKRGGTRNFQQTLWTNSSLKSADVYGWLPRVGSRRDARRVRRCRTPNRTAARRVIYIYWRVKRIFATN